MVSAERPVQRTLVAGLVLWVCHGARIAGAFTPPAASVPVLEGISLAGMPVGDNFRARFAECDTSNTCDGKPLSYGCSSDPNRNTTLLSLKDGVLFFDAKMGLDADGSPYSKNTPGRTDQPETSLRYPLPGQPSVNADRVPFIVLPGGGFGQALNVRVGDMATVVYGDRKVFAIVADQGPVCKIGEGSIQLHELLGHSVCQQRANNGDCVKLRNVGIAQGPLYFVFPGTREKLYPGLTPDNINQRIEQVGQAAWDRLRAP